MWAGALLAVIGLIAAGTWFVVGLVRMFDDVDALARVAAGQSTVVHVDPSASGPAGRDAGVEWEIFLEPSGMSLSGVDYDVVPLDGGAALIGPGHGFSYNIFTHSGRAVASVTLTPGRYEVRFTGRQGTLALGPSPSGQMRSALLGAALIGGSLVLAGIALAATSAVRDTRRRARPDRPPPPSRWSAGEWSPAADEGHRARPGGSDGTGAAGG